MQQLFQQSKKQSNFKPLAERARPSNIDEVLGQQHLIGENGPLRSFFEQGEFPSIIFWGPPGVGKTTFASLIANAGEYEYIRISAIESGVKEIRSIIEKAKQLNDGGKKTLLFIDEIHRFNKSQQDALLHAVETGLLTLIGATTENPSFEVNGALLSRCNVYKLKPLQDSDIEDLIQRTVKTDEKLKEFDIEIEDIDFLVNISGGDARTALNTLETSLRTAYRKDKEKIVLNREIFEKSLLRKTAKYDKKGDNHYDNISAFIKSMRGSDPDAAMLWMVKMLDAGEDPKFIARRMVIFASEDIGNANPEALNVAVNTFKAIEVIGLPEAEINMAQCVTYLASSPKSNAAYMALKEAKGFIRSAKSLDVPLHIRNAPTKLMKAEGYSEGYKYPHNYEGHFVKENYMPEGAEDVKFYEPTDLGDEKKIKEYLEKNWGREKGK